MPRHLLLILKFYLSLYIIESTICTNPFQYYNYSLVSDSNTIVFNLDGSYVGRAVPTQTPSAWTASIPGATWIWESYQVLNPNVVFSLNFRLQFFLVGNPVAATLQVAVDNSATSTVNGKSTSCSSNGFTSVVTCDVNSFLSSGDNYALFKVTNFGGPAGLLYKLTIQTLVDS